MIGFANSIYALAWPRTTHQTLRALADSQEATEYGATAIAVLLVKKEFGYAAVERAVKGTGIDYWLGHETDGPPFQHKARLEVSGILHIKGSHKDVVREIASRVRQKIRQTQPSSGSLPAYVIVVEFGTPLAEIQKTLIDVSNHHNRAMDLAEQLPSLRRLRGNVRKGD